MKENTKDLNISLGDGDSNERVLSRGTNVLNPYSEFDYESHDANSTPLSAMTYSSFKVEFKGAQVIDLENFLRLFGRLVKNEEMLLINADIQTYDKKTGYWVNIFGWTSDEWVDVSLDVAKAIQSLHGTSPVSGRIGSLDSYHEKAEISIRSVDWENGQHKWTYKANANIMWTTEIFTHALRTKHKASGKPVEF